MDNIDLLTPALHHSMTTSDLTSMELENNRNKNQREFSDNGVDGFDSQHGDCMDMDGGAHLPRSNSDQGLEMKSISREDPPGAFTGAHLPRSDSAERLDLLGKDEQTEGEMKSISREDPPGTFTGAHLPRSVLAERLDLLRKDEQTEGEMKSISREDPPGALTGEHLPRSDSAQRLDLLRKDEQTEGEMSISREDLSGTLTDEELSCMFEEEEMPAGGESPEQESKLSQLLEELSKYGENPFLEYARFDGRASISFTKKIDIFLTMASPAERVYPMMVFVVASATVQDLIGLICWQYTCEGREPNLRYPINHYCLYIAEDDGEVDWDFPCLDDKKPVLKFGFRKLALVPKDSIMVTINGPNQDFYRFHLDSFLIPMRRVLEKVINLCEFRTGPGVHYNLEKLGQPGIAVDLDSSLGQMDTMQFMLVKENSTPGDLAEAAPCELSHVADSLTTRQPRFYLVLMVNRLRPNTLVQLGINREKVEIDPVQVHRIIPFIRQKAVIHEVDSIADCDLLEKKSNGRAVFRLTYLTERNYKHHDFEADTNVATDIVQELKTILEQRQSATRKEFISSQEHKLRK